MQTKPLIEVESPNLLDDQFPHESVPRIVFDSPIVEQIDLDLLHGPAHVVLRLLPAALAEQLEAGHVGPEPARTGFRPEPKPRLFHQR